MTERTDDAENVVAFKPRPPEAPAPLRLELKLRGENCSIDFYLIHVEGGIRAAIPIHPDIIQPGAN